MENASKALIIAGAILLSILIIAVGIYIFNNAQGTIDESIASMNTQEIEGFNSQFTSYSNKQSGANVKALIGRLIANSSTYQDQPGKVPTVKVQNVTGVTNTTSNSRPLTACIVIKVTTSSSSLVSLTSLIKDISIKNSSKVAPGL